MCACVCVKAFDWGMHVLMYAMVINEYKCDIMVEGNHMGHDKSVHKVKVFRAQTHTHTITHWQNRRVYKEKSQASIWYTA